jgi:hypothetical protein
MHAVAAAFKFRNAELCPATSSSDVGAAFQSCPYAAMQQRIEWQP